MKERILRLKDHVADVCRRAGRDPAEVIIIGVTKYSSVPQIQEALDAGLTHIAENRVQDAKEKFPQLHFTPGAVTRHLIGHLQSNKAKLAVGLFDMIQSVDSLDLAKDIDRHAASLGKVMDVLIQVNCSGEEQKSGIETSEALKLIDHIVGLNNVRLQGLMTMAALTEDQNAVRASFRSLRTLRDEATKFLKGRGHGEMKFLSMGMSQDFEIAIEEGANMIRIGRAIFGE